MLYSSWNKGCNRQNFPSFGAKFYPFTPLTTQKIKIKIGKNTWRYYHFTHIHHKWQSHYVWFLRYGSQRMAFLSFWSVFSLLAPSEPRKSKYWKNEKSTSRYNFTNVCHKWQSYDVWFLRYGARRMEFFVILTIFYPFFTPLTTQKIKVLKNWKKTTTTKKNTGRYYHFTHA